MSQHTPGPWRVMGGSGTDVAAGPQGYLAYVSTGGGRGRSLDEARANARLIAAAPDLLDACEKARDFGSQGDTHEGLSVSEFIRAAIAKARGAES